MGPPDRNTVKGLFFKGAGARLLVLEGELVRMSVWAHGMSGWTRLDERLGSWYERLGSSL